MLRINDTGTSQDLSAQDFPVALGISEDGSPLFGERAESKAVAWLGQKDGDIFIQAVKGTRLVRLNGRPLEESAWLAEGHTITLGRSSIDVVKQGGILALSAVEADKSDRSRKLVVSTRELSQMEGSSAEGDLNPVLVTPIGPVRSRKTQGFIGLLAMFAVLVIGVVFVIVASPVRVTISPEPDSVSLRGLVPAVPFAGRYLVLPGQYSIVADKQGFRKLEQRINVAFGSEPVFSYKLLELPGYLDVTSQPVTSANVTIDGKAVGTTPLKSFELDAGQYELRVAADRYRTFSERIDIRGKGHRQATEVALVPGWGTLEITSEPSEAHVRLNGTEVGLTPLRVEPMGGQYHVEVRKSGWKPFSRAVKINANETVKLPPVHLEKIDGNRVVENLVTRRAKNSPPIPAEKVDEPRKAIAPPVTAMAKADGTLNVTTSPAGATVTVNGESRGPSPITLTLMSGRDHKIVVDKAGLETVTRTVSLDGDSPKSLHIDLAAQYGIVFLNTRPAGATLTVDGKFSGSASQRLQLTAAAHRLEITKAGYVPHSVMVTPLVGVSKTIEVSLDKVGEAPVKGVANETKTAAGQNLRLVRVSKPTRFQMGASRGEAGRRANETIYWVQLTRSFFMSEKEVTNKEYQKFNPQHNSGTENETDLNGPDQPVVSVSWDDAARYLNWLGKQEGLPPAYREADGKMVAIQPPTTGYRLPTEAEWTFAARYEGGSRSTDQPLKYPWEGGMPPPSKSGNYADEAASGKLPIIIKGYSDGYSVAAPVGTFAPNKAGIFDLGGNVSEWIHDYYDVYIGSGDGTLRDPMGPDTGNAHVVRGSSWRHGGITELRFSYRDSAQKSRNDLGFRIARYVTETPK